VSEWGEENITVARRRKGGDLFQKVVPVLHGIGGGQRRVQGGGGSHSVIKGGNRRSEERGRLPLGVLKKGGKGRASKNEKDAPEESKKKGLGFGVPGKKKKRTDNDIVNIRSDWGKRGGPPHRAKGKKRKEWGGGGGGGGGVWKKKK